MNTNSADHNIKESKRDRRFKSLILSHAANNKGWRYNLEYSYRKCYLKYRYIFNQKDNSRDT